MRSFFSILIVLVVTISSGSLAYGSASSRTSSVSVPRLSADNHKIQENRYFSRLTSTDKKDVIETAKIMFLIEEMKRSSYRFERNGKVYEAQQAAQHLMEKFSFMRNQIKTAEHFIEHLASRSSVTGKEYRLIVNDAESYPVRTILYNELSYLDQILNESPGRRN